ncbi:MAG TPA: HTTM domain-containing protein [Gemmata sp.]
MSDARVVGVRPWFPWPLSRWNWWNEPIPAERVAALRVAAALALLIDIGFGYLPHFTAFFGPDAVSAHLYDGRFRAGHAHWSVLRVLPEAWGARVLFGIWIGSAVALLVGWRPLVSGLLAWACAMSVWTFNPGLHNGGDRIRQLLLLVTAVSCSGTVWAVSSVRDEADPRPIWVPGWPVKLLFVQLAALYFFSGYYKALSPIWRSGYVMYWVSHDLGWSLCPGAADRVPVWAQRLSALVTLLWELGFPVLAVLRLTRAPTLVLGVLFHLGTLLTLEVGAFALYSIACYAAFAPWERLRGIGPQGADATPEPAR